MRRFCTLSQVLLISLLTMASAHSQDSSVQVIANVSVATDYITKIQARRIFSMRQISWNNDTTITVFVMEDQHQTHKIFSTQVLGLFPYQLDRIWNKLVYSGLGEEPVKVKNAHEMLNSISKTPGAIGYLMNNMQIDNANVKIIRVVKG